MDRHPGKKKTHADSDLVQEMAVLLKKSGIFLSEEQLAQLWSYHTLLRRYNPQLNLTRIRNFQNMVVKLYADSILPGLIFDLPSPLLDLGTGPGMPGIPLKIAFPHLEIILAESRQKRVGFLETVIKTLSLTNISFVRGSITPAFQEPVKGVITRAVEPVEKTLERIHGCLDTGGLALFMKGPHCDDEISAAIAQFHGRYRIVKDRAYQIPHTPHQRRLVVFQRSEKPFMDIRTDATAAGRRLHPIESKQNIVFKELKKLLTTRGIKKQKMALVSGEKLVADAFAHFPEECNAWITESDQDVPPPAAPAHMTWYRLPPHLFRALDIFGTGVPLLRIKTQPLLPWRPEHGFADGLSVLIPFQDPENVGAVIRSAVAFGAGQVILLGECAHPYHPKALRSSGGAALHAPLFQGPSIKELPVDLPIVALSPEGKDISEYPFPRAVGILTGLEGPGLPDHLRKNAFSIPIRDNVESLNAATATAIVLYLWSRSVES